MGARKLLTSGGQILLNGTPAIRQKRVQLIEEKQARGLRSGFGQTATSPADRIARRLCIAFFKGVICHVRSFEFAEGCQQRSEVLRHILFERVLFDKHEIVLHAGRSEINVLAPLL
jgi:hypothetical protein